MFSLQDFYHPHKGLWRPLCSSELLFFFLFEGVKKKYFLVFFFFPSSFLFFFFFFFFCSLFPSFPSSFPSPHEGTAALWLLYTFRKKENKREKQGGNKRGVQ
eukprot:TRINITY_DN1587_c1_g1_i1.p1 TRINITY_DN1587_c1_g1~~TRINITY_DN1587_c1_g1_i1.p1  ORF type:complete len:102 (-),score=15.10 TRINITY_DN1587_c1_g1_i1:72-377(-)